MTERRSKFSGHRSGLNLSGEEPANGHIRDPGSLREGGLVPALLDHVGGQERYVESNHLLACAFHGHNITTAAPFESTHFLTEPNSQTSGRSRLGRIVPKRPHIQAPGFGEWLRERRGERSMEQVAMQLRSHLGVVGMAIDRSLIKKMESGMVPNWPMLGAIAKTFDVPVASVILRVAGELQFPDAHVLFGDLSRQTSTGPSPSTSRTEGDVEHAQAEDLARSVEPRETELRQTLLDIASTILNQLGTEVVDHDRGAAGAPVSEAELRRRNRNAG